jgi:hypothetical protein
MTPTELLKQLAREGGAIVTSAECSEMEITAARACGRFSVNDDGIGFVRRHADWLALQKARELAHPNTNDRYSLNEQSSATGAGGKGGS